MIYAFVRPGNTIYPILSRYVADEFGERFDFRSDLSTAWPTLFVDDRCVAMAVVKSALEHGIQLEALEIDDKKFTEYSLPSSLRSLFYSGSLQGLLPSLRR